MSEKISCFITYNGEKKTRVTIDLLFQLDSVKNVFILAPEEKKVENAGVLITQNPFSTPTIELLAEKSNSDFSLFIFDGGCADFSRNAIERMLQVARQTRAAMVYADYHEVKNGQQQPHPIINYQEGSLRDDFDFGPVQLFRSDVLKSFEEENYQWAGYYALRLHASRIGELIHIPELLFAKEETDTRKSGEKQFDYVRGNTREKQIEMEEACTSHLKKIGAFLEPGFREVDFSTQEFPVEASVVIPVRNRIKTIDDAVQSVLTQKTGFDFNLIVVDNHSTDGTTGLLKTYAENKELIHIIPERKDLGIGGCWNEAVMDPCCGKFAVQLDSDDLYADENTLQKIINKFYEEKCAMVIGTYRMTNFNLEEIPPGIILHDEWTPENGPNNALRINGLGAPRAFYTPILREIKFPDVCYGEDYAVGLAISRTWEIGRIYDPVYLCRRWEDNTDASLNIAKLNEHNRYKDWIRTVELKARMRKVGSGQLQ